MRSFDVMVIGAGAVGNAIAREITKKNRIAVGVLEKEPDTAFGISGRNSGVLHAGFNNKPGSLMAKLCVLGSEGFEKEAEILGISFKKTGKLVIARFEEDIEKLEQLKLQGEANGVRELRVMGREALSQIVGYDAGVAALWSGMSGIFDPFQYTVALAEAAAAQGTEYFFGRKVTGISTVTGAGQFENQEESCHPLRRRYFLVKTENLADGQREVFQTKILVNSAGLFADEICQMAGIEDFKVYPCRGEYHILAKQKDSSSSDQGEKTPGLPEIPIYPIPNEKEGGLGVHLTPTIHGNIMIGPSAEYLSSGEEREDYSTTWEVMDKLREEGGALLSGLDLKSCIRSFSGVRPKLVSEKEGGYADFVIEESKQVPGFIQLVGIESPGLTSSIPIGRMVTGIVEEIMVREGLPMQNQAKQRNIEQQTETVPNDPGDQKMLCRCEGITEAAVLEAYDCILKIGAVPTVKGLKNRTRITMGNCQGSFCTINIIETLQKKRALDPLRLFWNGFGSRMLEGSVRE